MQNWPLDFCGVAKDIIRAGATSAGRVQRGFLGRIGNAMLRYAKIMLSRVSLPNESVLLF